MHTDSLDEKAKKASVLTTEFINIIRMNFNEGADRRSTITFAVHELLSTLTRCEAARALSLLDTLLSDMGDKNNAH